MSIHRYSDVVCWLGIWAFLTADTTQINSSLFKVKQRSKCDYAARNIMGVHVLIGFISIRKEVLAVCMGVAIDRFHCFGDSPFFSLQKH